MPTREWIPYPAVRRARLRRGRAIPFPPGRLSVLALVHRYCWWSWAGAPPDQKLSRARTWARHHLPPPVVGLPRQPSFVLAPFAQASCASSCREHSRAPASAPALCPPVLAIAPFRLRDTSTAADPCD